MAGKASSKANLDADRDEDLSSSAKKQISGGLWAAAEKLQLGPSEQSSDLIKAFYPKDSQQNDAASAAREACGDAVEVASKSALGIPPCEQVSVGQSACATPASHGAGGHQPAACPPDVSCAASGRQHELLPALLAPLRAMGDLCNVAVLNASHVVLLADIMQEEVKELHVVNSPALQAHAKSLSLKGCGPSPGTVIPVLDVTKLGSAQALVEGVEALMRARPFARAILLRGAGMLCWGLWDSIESVVDLHERLLKPLTEDILKQQEPQTFPTATGASVDPPPSPLREALLRQSLLCWHITSVLLPRIA
jgi:hypothetical protein